MQHASPYHCAYLKAWWCWLAQGAACGQHTIHRLRPSRKQCAQRNRTGRALGAAADLRGDSWHAILPALTREVPARKSTVYRSVAQSRVHIRHTFNGNLANGMLLRWAYVPCCAASLTSEWRRRQALIHCRRSAATASPDFNGGITSRTDAEYSCLLSVPSTGVRARWSAGEPDRLLSSSAETCCGLSKALAHAEQVGTVR